MTFPPKTLNLLHRSLMKETQISQVLDRRISSPTRITGFAPVQVQTGAGKTRAALRAALYIAAQNIADPEHARQVIYTTPRVENIKMEMAEVRKHIRGLRAAKIINATQEKLLHDSVIILPGRRDILADLMAWMKDREAGLSRQCLSPSPRTKSKQKGDLDLLYKLITGKSHAKMGLLKNALDAVSAKSKDLSRVTEEELKSVFNALDTIFLPQNSNVADVAENIIRVNSPEARMLFPRLFVTTPHKTQIVLMSTKRLLWPISAATKGEGLNLMQGTNFAPHIIFLDEGDAAFSDMLSHAFDELDKNEIDIASVVQTFAKVSVEYSFFENENIFQKLKELVKVSQDMCEEYKFHAPLRISTPLHQDLKGSFPQSLGDANTWEYSTVMAAVRHDPRSGTSLVPFDQEVKSLNWFFNDVRNDFDYRFSASLLSLVGSVQDFLKKNVSTNIEKSRIDQKVALEYVLDQLKMSAADKVEKEPVLINVLNTRMQNFMLHDKQKTGVPLSVHDLGMRFAKIWRAHSEWSHLSDASYQIYALSATKTPNNMLSTLARQHMVIGLSATIYSPSVTRNFDHKYLKECLGENLITMTESEIQALHLEYKQMRRFEESISKGDMNVERFEVDEIMSDDMKDIMSSAFKTLQREDGRLMNDRDLHLFCNMLHNGKDPGYHEATRIMRVLNAIQKFLLRSSRPQDEGARMMAFLGAGLKEWGMRGILWPKPEDLIKAVAAELGLRNGKTPSVQVMLTEDMRSMKEKQWIASPKTPLIILTTYATAGAGFNLQQYVSEPFAHLADIGRKGLSGDVVDFDAVYLDKSSYVILKGDACSPSGKIKNAYAIQSMAVTGIFSDTDMRRLLRNIVRAKDDTLKNVMGEVNKTVEARHVFMSEIIQALGRLSRTGLRRRRILHMVSHELMSFLSGSASDYPENRVSWEFYQLTMWARTKRPALQDTKTREKLFGRDAQDPTVLYSQAGAVINRTMKGLRSEHPAPYITQWEEYRVTAGRAPTAEPIRPGSQTDGQWMYMDDKDMSGRAVLFASHEDMTMTDTNAVYSLHAVDDAKFRLESSEKASRLNLIVKNSAVKSYFEEIGEATFWEPKGRLITPIVCQSIYMGEIGEQAIRALLREHDIGVGRMPDGQFEIFDMMAGSVPLDAKNYRGGFAGQVHAHQEYMIQNAVKKAVRIRQEKVLLVSVFGKRDGTVSRFQRDGVTIVMLDGVMTESGVTLSESLDILKEEVSKS